MYYIKKNTVSRNLKLIILPLAGLFLLSNNINQVYADEVINTKISVMSVKDSAQEHFQTLVVSEQSSKIKILSEDEVKLRIAKENYVKQISNLQFINEQEKSETIDKINQSVSLSEVNNLFNEKSQLNQKRKSEKEEAERKAREEAERKAREEALKRDGIPDFDSNGRLIEVGQNESANAERAITLLLSIPGHRNGGSYHQSTGLDNIIDQLTDAEAIHVIHRIEGPGFGQTGDGLAGSDSAYTDKIFVENQVNRRFNGNIRSLLHAWGTFSYGGY